MPAAQAGGFRKTRSSQTAANQTRVLSLPAGPIPLPSPEGGPLSIATQTASASLRAPVPPEHSTTESTRALPARQGGRAPRARPCAKNAPKVNFPHAGSSCDDCPQGWFKTTPCPLNQSFGAAKVPIGLCADAARLSGLHRPQLGNTQGPRARVEYLDDSSKNESSNPQAVSPRYREPTAECHPSRQCDLRRIQACRDACVLGMQAAGGMCTHRK